jgi:hypothetical protein
VQGDEDVAKLLSRFECVEWDYDGLGGKIIPWTKEHGGHSDDPSVQAFVVAPDGTVQARAPDAAPYRPGSFSKWLAEQAKVFDRAHPRLRMPFVFAEVTKGEPPVCAEVDEAHGAESPVLLYFGREPRDDAARDERKQSKACRSFERKTLDSKSAAAAAEGFVLLRFDLSREAHAAYATHLGVEAAPTLLLWLPGEEEPEDLGGRITSSALAYRLKKVPER